MCAIALCTIFLYSPTVTLVLRGIKEDEKEVTTASRTSASGDPSTSALFTEGHRKPMFYFYFLSEREN